MGIMKKLYQAFYDMLFNIVARFVSVNKGDIEFVRRFYCRGAARVHENVLRVMAKRHKTESIIFKYTHLRHF